MLVAGGVWGVVGQAVGDRGWAWLSAGDWDGVWSRERTTNETVQQGAERQQSKGSPKAVQGPVRRTEYCCGQCSMNHADTRGTSSPPPRPRNTTVQKQSTSSPKGSPKGSPPHRVLLRAVLHEPRRHQRHVQRAPRVAAAVVEGRGRPQQRDAGGGLVAVQRGARQQRLHVLLGGGLREGWVGLGRAGCG